MSISLDKSSGVCYNDSHQVKIRPPQGRWPHPHDAFRRRCSLPLGHPDNVKVGSVGIPAGTSPERVARSTVRQVPYAPRRLRAVTFFSGGRGSTSCVCGVIGSTTGLHPVGAGSSPAERSTSTVPAKARCQGISPTKVTTQSSLGREGCNPPSTTSMISPELEHILNIQVCRVVNTLESLDTSTAKVVSAGSALHAPGRRKPSLAQTESQPLSKRLHPRIL